MSLLVSAWAFLSCAAPSICAASFATAVQDSEVEKFVRKHLRLGEDNLGSNEDPVLDMGVKAIPYLLKVIDAPDTPEQAQAALLTLAHVRLAPHCPTDADAFRTIEKRLKDHDPDVRVSAIIAVSSIEFSQRATAIEEMLDDENAEVFAYAVNAAAAYAAKSAIPKLEARIRKNLATEGTERAIEFIQMRQLPEPEMLGALIAILNKHDTDLRTYYDKEWTIKCLVACKLKNSVEALRKLVSNEREAYALRRKACTALFQLGAQLTASEKELLIFHKVIDREPSGNEKQPK